MGWLASSKFRLALVLLIPVLWLAYETCRVSLDPRTPFLWDQGGVEWIICPMSAESTIQPGVAIDSIFVKQFNLSGRPTSVKLNVRMFKFGKVWINDRPVFTAQPGEPWKPIHEVAVDPSWLHEGANLIRAQVLNDAGPPALWLRLDAGNATISTGPGWGVAEAGALPVEAIGASKPLRNEANDGIGRTLAVGDAWRLGWRSLLLYFVAAGLAVGAVEVYLPSTLDPEKREARQRRLSLVVIGLVAGVWAVIGLHNAPLLDRNTGSDAVSAVEYIDYIYNTGSLLTPTHGWFGYQAPLYFVLNAGVLKIAGINVYTPAGIVVVRVVNVILGLIMLVFVGLTLRLVFPRSLLSQFVGLVFAAFLPISLYDQQFTSNASLLVASACAVYYVSMRVLLSTTSRYRDAILLGVCLSIALLSKVSALVLVPAIVGALVWRYWDGAKKEGARVEWVRPLKSLALLTIVVSVGTLWFYGPTWYQYGSPFVTNFSPEIGWTFWQKPGFVTLSQFLSFGSCLSTPLTWRHAAIFDQFFGSFWSDADLGGVADVMRAPPWNMKLLVMLPAMGLVMTLVMIAGAVICVRRFVVERDLVALLAPLTAFLSIILILHLYLRYGQTAFIKAQYALPGMTAFAILAAVGIEWAAGRNRYRRMAVMTLFLGWAIASAGAFVIDTGSAHYQTRQAMDLIDAGKPLEAIAILTPLNQADPEDGSIRLSLAHAIELAAPADQAEAAGLAALDSGKTSYARIELQRMSIALKAGRFEVAQKMADTGIADYPEFRFEFAWPMARAAWSQHRVDLAIRYAMEVIKADPKDAEAHRLLGWAFSKVGQASRANYHTDLAVRIDKWAADFQQRIAVYREDSRKTPQ